MTNKEALEILEHNWTRLVNPEYTGIKLGQAQDLAIKALEFAESQRICCDNCAKYSRKSKEVCTSPYGLCEFFDDKPIKE